MNSSKSGRYGRLLLVAMFALASSEWLLQEGAYSQSVRIGQSTPPYFVGEPITIQCSVEGFEASPQPVCRIVGKVPDGIEIQTSPPSRQISTYESRINGKITRTENVNLRFNFFVVADSAGTYTLGPFEVTQGTNRIEKESITFTVNEVEVDDDMRISISMPTETIYAGQRAPVAIRWSYAGDIENVRNLMIRSPLFDHFNFEDEARSRQDQGLPIQTSQGELILKASLSREIIDGREFVQLLATRTLLADEVGQFEFLPASASIRKVTRWSRDPFDDFPSPFRSRSNFRQPAASVPSRTVGEPLKVVVKPLPVQGRPESFSGAVGQSYSISTTANRSVVRVGDPISLNVAVRGNGTLNKLSLPPLSADGGMSPNQFRLPTDDPVGIFSDGQKQFNVAVRVLKPGIEEIPALAFSWFDPIKETYETTYSDPIAIKVMEGQTISSRDVVGSPQIKPETGHDGMSGDLYNEDPTRNNSARSPSSGPSLLANADLSISRDVNQMMVSPWDKNQSLVITISLYAFGVLFICWVWIGRRKANLDPTLLRQRNIFKEQLAKISEAATQPPREALQRIGNALRVAIAESPNAPNRGEAEALLRRIDAQLFAPATADATLETSILQDAQKIIERMSRVSR